MRTDLPLPAIEARALVKDFVINYDYGSIKRMMLDIRALRRRERKVVHALRGIDLTVERGETVALIGRNGSGKSTLLGLIGRIYRPASGELQVRGHVCPLLELGAGFHHELTGLENIYLNGAILGLSRKQIEAGMEEIIDFSELRDSLGAPIRTYSKGMVMRLGFAIAAYACSEILLVDEVLAVGDEAFQEKCYRRIAEFQRRGVTIILVSHFMDDVRRVARRTVWLNEGQIRADGPTECVVQEYLEFSHDLADEDGLEGDDGDGG
jgi:ABC-type polysaccharide/polyol phosphate transport system ATPase subunit